MSQTQVLNEAGQSSGPSRHRSFGRPLTAKQERIWELRVGGKTSAQVALETGVSVSVVNKAMTVIRRKLGKVLKDIRPRSNTFEISSPDRAAAVIDAATDPEAKLKRIRDVAEAEGVPLQLTAALLRRWRARFPNTGAAMRDLKTRDLLQMVNERLDLTLGFMDSYTAAGASHRDLGLVAAALIEKRQLLRGEPTAIVSDLERKKLHELLPALMLEGRRRGITMDGKVLSSVVSKEEA